jgi:hypothetical protein
MKYEPDISEDDDDDELDGFWIVTMSIGYDPKAWDDLQEILGNREK